MTSPISVLETQLRSALLGLAVGDALGVPVEFTSRVTRQRDPVTHMRAYGTHHQPAGTWSDDASLTFCLAEALTENYSVHQLASNCVRWVEQGFWTPHGKVFDIGITTREALYQLTKLDKNASPLVGGKDEMSNGNGALMRILPLAFYRITDALQTRFQRIQEASAITHGHVRSAIACFLYLEMAAYLRQGLEPQAAYAQICKYAPAQMAELELAEKEINCFQRILDGTLPALPEPRIASSGYVVHTLEAALWCLLKHETYASTVLAAVNLGEDTDTTGAVVGGLAGIWYGEKNIPKEWLEVLARRDDIEKLANRMTKTYTPAFPRPIPNSYWATEYVLGCEYPGDLREEKARAKLTALLAAGITDFYDLTEPHELKSYELLLQKVASETGRTVTYQRFPIRDVNVPNLATLETILAALADTVSSGRKAAVHCWGGIGRTGTVIGCYLVRAQHLSGEQALATLAELWQGVEKSVRKPHSPETAAQCRLVEEFR